MFFLTAIVPSSQTVQSLPFVVMSCTLTFTIVNEAWGVFSTCLLSLHILTLENTTPGRTDNYLENVPLENQLSHCRILKSYLFLLFSPLSAYILMLSAKTW